jgi:hypothetical protein
MFCLLPTEATHIAGLHPQRPRQFSAGVSYLSHTLQLPYKHTNTGISATLNCRNISIYAHTNLRTLPTCDISLGSLIQPAPEAGHFAELILLNYPSFIFLNSSAVITGSSVVRQKGACCKNLIFNVGFGALYGLSFFTSCLYLCTVPHKCI